MSKGFRYLMPLHALGRVPTAPRKSLPSSLSFPVHEYNVVNTTGGKLMSMPTPGVAVDPLPRSFLAPGVGSTPPHRALIS